MFNQRSISTPPSDGECPAGLLVFKTKGGKDGCWEGKGQIFKYAADADVCCVDIKKKYIYIYMYIICGNSPGIH